jgi:outer membrane receptor protein involved in Fe transport
VIWRARPDLMLRGTYSEGFRAPNLAESGSAASLRRWAASATRCAATKRTPWRALLKSKVATDADLGKSLLNSNCSTTVGGLTPPNPNLRPEKAKISTAGLVLQPAKDVSISVDYWFINRRDEIVRQDFNELLRNWWTSTA